MNSVKSHTARGYVHHLLSRMIGRQVMPNESVMVPANFVYIQDRVAPYIFSNFSEALFERKLPLHLYFDHEGPASDIEVANKMRMLKEEAKKYGIKTYTEGTGIAHQIVTELHVWPHQIVCSTDSHVSQVGGLGAMGIEVGALEATLIAQNECVMVVCPPVIPIHLTGAFQGLSTAFDLMMFLEYRFGESLKDMILEFHGPGVKTMSMESRFTLANLATDIGALYGIVPPDKVTQAWLERTRTSDEVKQFWVEEIRVPLDLSAAINIDLADVPLMALTGEGPKTLHDILNGAKVNRIAIGSCTHGSAKDIKDFANSIISEFSSDVLVTVTPGSRKTLIELVSEGIIEQLARKGVVVNPPGCGPCMGLGHGVVGDEEVVITTHNNSKRGRMGSKNARLFAVNPKLAARFAQMGFLVQEALDLELGVCPTE